MRKVSLTRTRARPSSHGSGKFRDFATDGAETDEQNDLTAKLAWPHGSVPQFLLGPQSFLLIAKIVREAVGESDEYAEDMFGHWNAMDAAGIGDFDAAAAQLGVHQLPDARSGGMKPEKLARPGALLRGQG